MSSHHRSLSYGIAAALGALLLGVADLRADDASGKVPYARTAQALRQQIPALLRQHNIVGLSIALIDDQSIVWSQGFGYADKSGRIKADGDTIYRAGSITKLFTATAAMQLAEQGTFDIDQAIQTYVPEFSMKSRFDTHEAITPRLLMTHHSGLPTDYQKAWGTAASFAKTLESLRDEYVAFPPKHVMSYSNLGVSLLGQAIANVCGKPFETCLQQQLLQPLGMTTAELSHRRSTSPRMAKGYVAGREAPEHASVLRDVPAGGLNASVRELARFAQMVFANGVANGRVVLSADRITEMFRPQNGDVALDLDDRVGLAWGLSEWAGRERSAAHSGGIGSFNSLLLILPDSKLGVVVMSNSAESDVVLGAIAGSSLAAMEAEKGVITGATVTANADSATVPAPVDAYPGHYATGFGVLRIRRSGKSLAISVDGRPVKVRRQANGRFLANLPSWGEVLLDRLRLSGHEMLVVDSPVGRSAMGEKVEPRALSAAWRQRAGAYVVQNPDADTPDLNLRLTLRHGLLIVSSDALERAQLGRRVLIPLNDREAILAGVGRGLGETVFAEGTGDDTEFRYSGYRFKRR